MDITNFISSFTIFSVTYYIYSCLMNRVAEKREFKYWRPLNYFSIFLFSLPIALLSFYFNLYIYLIHFLSFILYAVIFYRSSFQRHVVNAFMFYLVRYLSIYSFQIIFTTAIDFLHMNPTYYIDFIIDVIIFIGSVLVLFIITKQLLTKLLTDDGNEFNNNQFAILLFPSIVGFISLYMFTNYADDQNNLDISSILLALAAVCVVFILVYLANIKTLHAKEKTEALLRKSEAFLKEKEKFLQENMDLQYNYFQEVQKTQEDLRKIHHDLNHHLASIDAMAGVNDVDGVRRYVSSIRKILKPADKIYDTGSGILDVILNEKYEISDKKGIKFKVIGTFENGCNLDPMSISVIFANLIDNAIEACDRMKNPKAYKRIQVTFYQDDEEDNEIFILVENTCDKGSTCFLTNGNAEIVTSKEDKKAHGIGLQSVKSEVEKYNGKLEIEATDIFFRVTITIPIK